MSNISWAPAQSVSFIPQGNFVSFTAIVQAAYTQAFQIVDGSGNPISYTDGTTGQTKTFPITSSGTAAHMMGGGSLTWDTSYKIQFGSSGSSAPQVADTNIQNLKNDDTIYSQGQVFGTEDGGGTDFNDTVLWLQSYNVSG